MKLLIASNNPGKIREYREILEPFGFQVASQSEANIRLEVAETGTTFEENAALKARAIYERCHCCVISDDSGLEVEALGGEPGLYSARYKGLGTEHERRMAVLKGLEGSDNRRARFVTCICSVTDTSKCNDSDSECHSEHCLSVSFHSDFSFSFSLRISSISRLAMNSTTMNAMITYT